MKGKSRGRLTRHLHAALVLAFWVVGCAQQGSGGTAEVADVVIELTNVDSVVWVVTRVEGAQGVAELDVQNPLVALAVGTRYRFVNHGTLAIHPFAIRGKDGEPVLGQRPNDRPFERDPKVAFQADEEGVTFTLTEALAEVMETYYCTAHPTPLMEGELELRTPSATSQRVIKEGLEHLN